MMEAVKNAKYIINHQGTSNHVLVSDAVRDKDSQRMDNVSIVHPSQGHMMAIIVHQILVDQDK